MNYVEQSQNGNQFLALLPKDEYQQLLPDLEKIRMEIGSPVHEADELIKWVYFPINCIISQVTTLNDGFSVEAGVIGREGCSGIEFVFSRSTSPRPTHVQLAGDCFKIRADEFSEILEQNVGFNKVMRQFSFAYFSQVTQVIACNSHHRIEERLARWLLMCLDRADGNELRITQEFIAQMLGVHRPGVTMAILSLKESKLISNHRGVIVVEDRDGLEEFSCECYAEINREYSKYLSTNNR